MAGDRGPARWTDGCAWAPRLAREAPMSSRSADDRAAVQSGPVPAFARDRIHYRTWFAIAVGPCCSVRVDAVFDSGCLEAVAHRMHLASRLKRPIASSSQARALMVWRPGSRGRRLPHTGSSWRQGLATRGGRKAAHHHRGPDGARTQRVRGELSSI